MSYKIYQVNEALREFVPREIIDLEERATWATPKGVLWTYLTPRN